MATDIRLTPDDRAVPGPKRRGPSRSSASVQPGQKSTPGSGRSAKPSPGRGKAKSAKSKSRAGSNRRKAASKRRGLWWWARKAVYLSFILALWGGIAVVGVLGYFAYNMPPPSQMAIPDRPANVRIVAMDGSLLGNRGPTGGEAVRLFELPPHLPAAVLAIEDRRFYAHFGVDPIGLARAMMVNVQAGGVVQGGSTLTQQLAKNLFLEHERTIERKIQEMLIALWLEWRFSKDEILEMYLNRVYLGEGATGVEAAARRYYNKSAREVNLSEAATIAGLLKAPSRFAPSRNPERAERRMRVVLNSMVEAGFVSAADVKLALSRPAEVRTTVLRASSNYVADFVMEQVVRILGEVREDIIVDTSINPRLQQLAEDAVAIVLENEGEERKASQGAIISLDTTGAVRALVGGRDYIESQFNRATKARRQPGSAFKPFVYLAALEYGLSPDALRMDQPVRYGDWSPKNYSDKFLGPVSLAEALSRSINTVAVQLTDEVGPDRVIEIAHRLGIDSEMKRNLSIGLGTSETSLHEITSAYVPMANGGFEVLPHVVKRIRTVAGDVLFERAPPQVHQVLQPEIIGQINYMMALTVDDGTARRAQLPGGRPAAGKTGTTQDFKDAWFIGYTGDLVTGVWIGNDDGSSMNKVTGGSLPAMIWQDYMSRAHDGFPIAELPGWYLPTSGMNVAMDQTLPWLADGQQFPQNGMPVPQAELTPQQVAQPVPRVTGGRRSSDPSSIVITNGRENSSGGFGQLFGGLFGGARN